MALLELNVAIKSEILEVLLNQHDRYMFTGSNKNIRIVNWRCSNITAKKSGNVTSVVLLFSLLTLNTEVDYCSLSTNTYIFPPNAFLL